LGEIAEPEEGDTFCAISPVLPILRVCLPTMSLAGGSPLMPSMMMILATSLCRQQLPRREAAYEIGRDGGGHLAAMDAAEIEEANEH